MNNICYNETKQVKGPHMEQQLNSIQEFVEDEQPNKTCKDTTSSDRLTVEVIDLSFLNVFLSDLDTILQNTLHWNNLLDSLNE